MRSIDQLIAARSTLDRVEAATNVARMTYVGSDNETGSLAEYRSVANHDLTTTVEFNPNSRVISEVAVVVTFNFSDGDNSHASISFRTIVGSNKWSVLHRADPGHVGNQGVKDAATVAGQLKILATYVPYDFGDDTAALAAIKHIAEFLFVCEAFDRPTTPAASAG